MSVMATHLMLLTRAFDKSEGPVLEMGTGYFSTLYLDWLCSMTGRKLVSYENNKKFPYWEQRALKYQSSYHEVNIIDDWDKADIDNTHWGLAFIDHAPKGRRRIDVARLKDNADYIVMHDTEPGADKFYKYRKIWNLFKYRYNYKKIEPWTSVVSNFKKLGNM